MWVFFWCLVFTHLKNLGDAGDYTRVGVFKVVARQIAPLTYGCACSLTELLSQGSLPDLAPTSIRGARGAHPGKTHFRAPCALGRRVLAHLALSKVADAVFPMAPNPTPTARPSETDIKKKNTKNHEGLGETFE